MQPRGTGRRGGTMRAVETASTQWGEEDARDPSRPHRRGRGHHHRRTCSTTACQTRFDGVRTTTTFVHRQRRRRCSPPHVRRDEDHNLVWDSNRTDDGSAWTTEVGPSGAAVNNADKILPPGVSLDGSGAPTTARAHSGEDDDHRPAAARARWDKPLPRWVGFQWDDNEEGDKDIPAGGPHF